jgi:hypothetical protein
MKKMSLKRWWLLYGFLLLSFLIIGKIAGLFHVVYRPVVIRLVQVIFYLFPAILLGNWLNSLFKRRRVWWVICMTFYGVAVLFNMLLFLLFFYVPEERGMRCGYLELVQGNFLQASTRSYAEPKAIFFMRPFQWDPEHDIHILQYTYQMQFTLAEDQGDGINRYNPEGYPDLAVRIYFYNRDGVTSDFQYKLTSGIVLDYCKEHQLSWNYEMDDYYEGNMEILIDNNDNLEEYSADLAAIITKALEDPFFKSNQGWISVRIEEEHSSLGFGMPGRVPVDFYADQEHILAKLKELGER